MAYEPLTVEQILAMQNEGGRVAQEELEERLNPTYEPSEADEQAYNRYAEEWADYEKRVEQAQQAQLEMERSILGLPQEVEDPILQALHKAQTPAEVRLIMAQAGQLRRVGQ